MTFKFNSFTRKDLLAFIKTTYSSYQILGSSTIIPLSHSIPELNFSKSRNPINNIVHHYSPIHFNITPPFE